MRDANREGALSFQPPRFEEFFDELAEALEAANVGLQRLRSQETKAFAALLLIARRFRK